MRTDPNFSQQANILADKRDTLAASIDVLNDDVLIRIFEFLNLEDRLRLRRTSRRWKRLLERQLARLSALRIGSFELGGFQHTSGLRMQCHHQTPNHRQQTATIFDARTLSWPPDSASGCFAVRRFDLLQRSIKFCAQSVTMLSLGHINLSYRLLLVITHNLTRLEHLELIGCASAWASGARADDSGGLRSAPSGNSLNSLSDAQYDAIYSNATFNQHSDEQTNMSQRLVRAAQLKKCTLYAECRRGHYWARLKHLLVKDCNLLNELSLCLILAITSRSLEHLCVESSQNLTGEFLNYCAPTIRVLGLKYCPSIQAKFLDDLIKIKQILYPTCSPPITIIN